MDPHPHASVVTLRTIEEIAAVQEAVRKQVAQHGFDRTAQFAIRLALEEALSNAIRHGNRDDPSKMTRLEYRVDADIFAATICDEGRGFDPENLPDPTAAEYLEQPGGRGVLLMHAYMTRVIYNDAGNCVTLLRRKTTK